MYMTILKLCIRREKIKKERKKMYRENTSDLGLTILFRGWKKTNIKENAWERVKIVKILVLRIEDP